MGRSVLNVPQMNWNDCYNSLAMAIYGACRYTGKQYSLEELLVYTGQGFVLNTDRNVGPMDVFGDGESLKQGLDTLGFDVSVLAANICGREWSDDAPSRAIAMMRDSIDRGIPAVGWNLENYEHGLIYGYDDEKQILFIHDISARGGGELPYEQYGRRGLNGQPHDPEVFVLIVHDRDDRPHANVTRYDETQDRSYRSALQAAFQLAVRHMDGAGTAGERKNGIGAIDLWNEAFRAGTAHPFFTTYNLLWITSMRQYVANFFIRSGITHCMSIQDLTLQRHMLEAAERCLDGFRAWVALRQLFPFPGGGNTKDAASRDEALRLLDAARQAETATRDVLINMIRHLQEA